MRGSGRGGDSEYDGDEERETRDVSCTVVIMVMMKNRRDLMI